MAALANMSAAELRAAAEAAEAAERARQEQQGAPDFRETAARLEQKLEQAVSLLSTQAEKIDRLEASRRAKTTAALLLCLFLILDYIKSHFKTLN